MPISAARMKLYPGGSIRSPEWQAIRARIAARSGNRCETCGAPNGEIICRGEHGNAGTYMLERGEVFDAETGARLGIARGSEYEGRFVKVILTVAHLNHDPADNRDENLAHLCQLHHNAHDAAFRAGNAARTRDAKTGQTSLFGGEG